MKGRGITVDGVVKVVLWSTLQREQFLHGCVVENKSLFASRGHLIASPSWPYYVFVLSCST